MSTPTINDVFNLLDEMALQVTMMQDCNYPKSWTAKDMMMRYTFVYEFCNQPSFHSHDHMQLYDKYQSILRERINKKVLPSLANKDGVPMLKELIQLWSEYEYLARHIALLVDYSDRYYLPRQALRSLFNVSRQLFHDLVGIKDLYSRLQESTLGLIREDREGKLIDREMIKKVLEFLAEMSQKGCVDYYKYFEEIMLTETAKFYHQLSLDNQSWRDLFAHYMKKEEEIAKVLYPEAKGTGKNLLEVVKYILRAKIHRFASHNDTEGLSTFDQLSLLEEEDDASIKEQRASVQQNRCEMRLGGLRL